MPSSIMMSSSTTSFGVFPVSMLNFVAISLMTWTAHAYVTRIEQCEPIKIPRCQSMPYNLTQMPNLMHHNTQKNARLIFEKFEMLIDQQCSEDLLFFLCSVFVPICPVSLTPDVIPPCRKICERARAGCEPLMRSYNVSWPESMECSRFPLYDNGLCILPAAFVTPETMKKCKCKRKRPSFKMFRKHKYDYAIRIWVQRRFKVSKTDVKYQVKATQVLFCGKVKFKLNSEEVIWSNATSSKSCSACPPKLRAGRQYLLMGHEDRTTNQLTITRHSVAGRWKDSWPRRIKRWRLRLQSRGRSQRRRKKNRRRNRGRDRRPAGGSGQREKRPNSTTNGKRPGSRRKSRPGPPSKTFPRKTSKPGSEDIPVPDIIDGYTHGGRFYTKTKKRNYKRSRVN